MFDKITPRMPMLGEYVRNLGTLVYIETVPPPPPPPPVVEYIFAEISAVCETLLSGKVVSRWHESTDFYGKGTSVESCIEDAQKYCAESKLTKDDDKIEVRVVRKVEYFRKLPKGKLPVSPSQLRDVQAFYDRQFMDFDHKPYGSRYNVPEMETSVVWSSKKDL